jgi:endonuclease/exonuclease/phosphatase family metal-dependent hydrolase
VPPLPKPKKDFRYLVEHELAALRAHKALRQIPEPAEGRLLLATWNIANLGRPGQERRPKDHRLIAEIIGWFDLVAVQEVANDLDELYAVRDLLPDNRRLLISDTAGNDERTAFIYDSRKVEQRELVGRLSIPPSQLRYITLPGVDQPFQGFDRSPYLAAFRAGSFTPLLASVHLFFGSDRDPQDIGRRALEAFAIARWAQKQHEDPDAYTHDVIALGDFNLPQVDPGDPIYKALTSRGLVLPEHSTAVGGSSLGGSKHYDQLALFPTQTKQPERVEPFDFDNAVFRGLWDPQDPNPFLIYTRHYLSDHRPLWAEFSV